MNTLDRAGIPGCAIATEAFQPAAAAQSKALGFEPAIAWLPHPIQNRTESELGELAQAVIDEVLSAIQSTHATAQAG